MKRLKIRIIKWQDIHTCLLTITLSANKLNAFIKRHVVAEWRTKQDPYICCLQETHFRSNDTHRLKGIGKDIS